jgi:hypothetical protein
MAEPKEFWIGWPDAEHPEVISDQEVASFGERGAIRFIEKSAYKDLKAKADRLAEALDQLIKLKTWKELGRNMESYKRDKPKAWSEAISSVVEYRGQVDKEGGDG